MKKIALFLFLLCTATFVQAQGFRPGIKAGLNYTNVVGKSVDSNKVNGQLGFHAGAILGFELSDMFTIQPEILYSTKGFGFGEKDADFFDTVRRRREGRMRLHYVDVPVMLKVNAGPLYFELGPSVSYLVTATSTVKATAVDEEGTPQAGVPVLDFDGTGRKGFGAFDYGINAGVGGQFMGALVGLRYQLGLAPMEDGNRVFPTSDIKNSVLMLSVGYMLPTNR